MLCLELFECMLDLEDMVSQNCCIGNIVSSTLHPAEFIFFILICYSSVLIGRLLRNFRTIPFYCLSYIDVAWLNSSELTFVAHFNVCNHIFGRHVVLSRLILLWSILPFLRLDCRRLIVNKLGRYAILLIFN